MCNAIPILSIFIYPQKVKMVISTQHTYVSYYKGVEHNYTKLIDNELYDRVL